MAKVICFYGVDHKCGCTMLAQCFGEAALARFPDLKAVLLHMETVAGLNYSEGTRVCMDDILPYLKKSSLDFAELAEKSAWRRNFSVIGGSLDFRNMDDFMPDMGKFLIEGLKEQFDIIICSCGPDFGNGLCVASLMDSDLLYMVMSPRESCVRRFEMSRKAFDLMGLEPDSMILNRFGVKSIYSASYLGERLGMDRSRFLVVRESKNGDVCEMEYRSLLNYRDNAFKKDINALAGKILGAAGIEEAYNG